VARQRLRAAGHQPQFCYAAVAVAVPVTGHVTGWLAVPVTVVAIAVAVLAQPDAVAVAESDPERNPDANGEPDHFHQRSAERAPGGQVPDHRAGDVRAARPRLVPDRSVFANLTGPASLRR
jgi:hypothetical protein